MDLNGKTISPTYAEKIEELEKKINQSQFNVIVNNSIDIYDLALGLYVLVRPGDVNETSLKLSSDALDGTIIEISSPLVVIVNNEHGFFIIFISDSNFEIQKYGRRASDLYLEDERGDLMYLYYIETPN